MSDEPPRPPLADLDRPAVLLPEPPPDPVPGELLEARPHPAIVVIAASAVATAVLLAGILLALVLS